MIYEYAIDPALVKDWVLARDVGLAGQFGMDHRRIVSDLDDNWKGEVYSLVLEHFELDCSSAEFIDAEQFMTALLKYLEQNTSRGIRRTDRWLDQILQVHKSEPFHAILSSQLIQGCDEVITQDVTRDLMNPLWYLPTIKVTRKTADSLAQQLASFLRLANKIILVDPYFDADDDKYCEVLAALLEKTVTSRANDRASPEVILISGVDHRQKGRESKSMSPEEQHLRESRLRCRVAMEKLGKFIPLGMNVTFKCVAAFRDGDEVHNRYLLTDIGGATIPYGTHPTSEHIFDDITPLYEGQYRVRWRQYEKSENLNVIGDAVKIQGLCS